MKVLGTQERGGPWGWEGFKEEMGLVRPEGRVDLGIGAGVASQVCGTVPG